MNSPEFRKLVDLKLAELEALPLGDQARPLGLTPTRRSELRSSLLRELPGVLRRDAPAFDFEQTVTTLDALWAQSSKLP